VNVVMNLCVLEDAGNSLTSQGSFSFSGGTQIHVVGQLVSQS
jgi:hypothetical protein